MMHCFTFFTTQTRICIGDSSLYGGLCFVPAWDVIAVGTLPICKTTKSTAVETLLWLFENDRVAKHQTIIAHLKTFIKRFHFAKHYPGNDDIPSRSGQASLNIFIKLMPLAGCV
ncbi:hypothetical protein T4E_4281 [Trichinella pseudospiralis]|uniref:Uncharacterized protein n=1 Tax=Trichinella pseudospiralis TaxID=6337 RepID=A0A0V0XRS6_TRIPS|nr:hypothetical protein T4E_4281 [Trichinella pseudospiralis]